MCSSVSVNPGGSIRKSEFNDVCFVPAFGEATGVLPWLFRAGAPGLDGEPED